MQIKRSIGPLGMLFAALGGIIGSGWLFGPFLAAQTAGPASLISWFIGGCLMMTLALTFAELTTMFPIAGGIVRYTHFSHGALASFTMAWIGWLSCVVVAPLETMAALQYSANYLPWLITKDGNLTLLSTQGTLLTAVIMLFMCILNAIGVKIVTRTNTLIVWFKLFVPFITIALLFYYGFHWHHLSTLTPFAPFGLKGILEALPSAGIIFSFIGFTTAISLAGESKNPQRAIPIAIIGSLGICIILYMLLQLAFIGSLKPEWLQQGWHHLQFKGDVGPIAGLITILGISWFVAILYINAVISPFGTGLTYTTATARMNYAMAQNGYMPHMMLDLNKNGVPMKAILVNFIIGLFLLLPLPSWQHMVEFLVSAVIISYATGPLSLIALRREIPEQKRPFKLFSATAICLLAFYIANLIAYWTGWHTISHVLILVALGYIWLAIYKFTNHGKNLHIHFRSMQWLIPYFAGLGLISYLGAFKGKQVISFGWDFLVLGLFSIIIFILALRSRLNKAEITALLAQENL